MQVGQLGCAWLFHCMPCSVALRDTSRCYDVASKPPCPLLLCLQFGPQADGMMANMSRMFSEEGMTYNVGGLTGGDEKEHLQIMCRGTVLWPVHAMHQSAQLPPLLVPPCAASCVCCIPKACGPILASLRAGNTLNSHRLIYWTGRCWYPWYGREWA